MKIIYPKQSIKNKYTIIQICGPPSNILFTGSRNITVEVASSDEAYVYYVTSSGTVRTVLSSEYHNVLNSEYIALVPGTRLTLLFQFPKTEEYALKFRIVDDEGNIILEETANIDIVDSLYELTIPIVPPKIEYTKTLNTVTVTAEAESGILYDPTLHVEIDKHSSGGAELSLSLLVNSVPYLEKTATLGVGQGTELETDMIAPPEAVLIYEVKYRPLFTDEYIIFNIYVEDNVPRQYNLPIFYRSRIIKIKYGRLYCRPHFTTIHKIYEENRYIIESNIVIVGCVNTIPRIYLETDKPIHVKADIVVEGTRIAVYDGEASGRVELTSLQYPNTSITLIMTVEGRGTVHMRLLLGYSTPPDYSNFIETDSREIVLTFREATHPIIKIEAPTVIEDVANHRKCITVKIVNMGSSGMAFLTVINRGIIPLTVEVDEKRRLLLESESLTELFHIDANSSRTVQLCIIPHVEIEHVEETEIELVGGHVSHS